MLDEENKKIVMDKKSKILIGVVFMLILISIAIVYYRYVVLKDFPVEGSMQIIEQ